MKKKELQKKNDVLLAIGEEGKKGDKAFKEHIKEVEKKEQASTDFNLNLVSDNKKTRDYNAFLTKILLETMRNISWPFGWTYKASPTDIGVVFEMKSPDGRIFRNAFRPTRDPLLDVNAVETYRVRAENTIDRVTGADGIITKI